MSAAHFDVAVTAFRAALGDRLASGITDFVDLFTEDAVIEIPFDGDGTVPPVVGRAAIARMTADLAPVLRFESKRFTEVRITERPDVVVCEYEAVLTRADLRARLRRRYISIVTLRDGRVLHLREHGGPFRPA